MPLPSTINLAYSGKTRWLVPRASESTTPGATSKSFNTKVFINPDTLVNHRFGSSTPDSIQINMIQSIQDTTYMYARWGQYTTLIQVQLEYSQVRMCCYYRRTSQPGPQIPQSQWLLYATIIACIWLLLINLYIYVHLKCMFPTFLARWSRFKSRVLISEVTVGNWNNARAKCWLVK